VTRENGNITGVSANNNITGVNEISGNTNKISGNITGANE